MMFGSRGSRLKPAERMADAVRACVSTAPRAKLMLGCT